MTFQQLKPADGPLPAAKLHQLFVQIGSHISTISDWKRVLAAGVSFTEAEMVIRWLRNGGLPDLPHSRTIARNIAQYVTLASRDPMASCLTVSIEAFEMAIRIADAGFEIEAEYVQDALNQYRAYLVRTPTDDLLYNHLPPGRIFVEQWFTETMARGTPRMRRFHSEHIKFKEFIRLTARAARRG